MKKITIAHLYPREMNIYGDLGNVICLRKRLEWRGYEVEVVPVEIGQPFNFGKADIVFGGGGQDSGQLIMGDDLAKRGADIREAMMNGLPMLVICGTYQLFGRGFRTNDGQDIKGIDVFNATTIGGNVRMIGNIVVQSAFGQLVGFENHSGQTILEPDQPSLGEVIKGFGNNPSSGQEGAVIKNVIGSYMHGPLLPKNPRFADHLIGLAVRRRFGEYELVSLDDSIEQRAAEKAANLEQ